uniref:Thioredoxin domain containing 16 n=1 Tax=Propithecus coquereli TaxID=379532 RepID=A0A2K6FEY1_PROCO
MSSSFNVFRVGISFVITCIFYKSTVDSLPELSPQKYFSTLQPGKASLAYFCQTGKYYLKSNMTLVMFVNCVREEMSRYCGKEKDSMKAYLFRGNILLREFPTDTLFDVNAIVAHVLFALLFNEVKYITTLEDLQNIENALKGKENIVFSYVRAIGIPEHRAVMEAAFVYGTIYQFVLTTEIALLESIGSHFVCVCVFFLMKTEVAEDPQQVSTVHLQLGLPLVFIVSQQATYEADRRTAEWVAWRLLGKAGVLLLLRDSLKMNIPQHANVVFKRAEKGVPLEFLVLRDVESIISHVENNMHIEEIQEDEDDDMEDADMDIQDDEVAETVYRDRKRQLPLELTVELTEETFNVTVMASDSLVLFYAGWQAVSMAFLQSYIDVAIKLKGIVLDIKFREVNCESIVLIVLSRRNNDYSSGSKEKSTVSDFCLVCVFIAKEDFTEAGNHLKGYVITGIYSEEDPEITVGNLPTYLRLQKPLLILFSDGSINPQYEKAILTLAKQKYLDTFTPCGQVFAFPSDQAITELNLVLWLKKLEAGLENPIKILPAQEWKPPLPAYDFLSMMDAASQYPTRKVPECMKQTDVQENDKEQHEDKSATRKQPVEALRIKHWNRSNWFKEAEKSFRRDKEL